LPFQKYTQGNFEALSGVITIADQLCHQVQK